ncbi:MAG: hypothetical protein QXU85_05705 [Sulfolobales archaeon]
MEADDMETVKGVSRFMRLRVDIIPYRLLLNPNFVGSTGFVSWGFHAL